MASSVSRNSLPPEAMTKSRSPSFSTSIKTASTSSNKLSARRASGVFRINLPAFVCKYRAARSRLALPKNTSSRPSPLMSPTVRAGPSRETIQGMSFSRLNSTKLFSTCWCPRPKSAVTSFRGTYGILYFCQRSRSNLGRPFCQLKSTVLLEFQDSNLWYVLSGQIISTESILVGSPRPM